MPCYYIDFLIFLFLVPFSKGFEKEIIKPPLACPYNTWKNNLTCTESDECLIENKGKYSIGFCYYALFHSRGICCYGLETGSCPNGQLMKPIKRCDIFEDCRSRNDEFENWCDSKGKMCCSLENKKKHNYCPDNFVSLLSQPPCEKSKNCAQRNSICHFGFCCPNIHYVKDVYYSIQGKSYRTEIECLPSKEIPPNFKHAYCYEGKIWILGDETVIGEEILPLGTRCTFNSDCGITKGMENICVRLTEKFLTCYLNPKVYLKETFGRSQWFTSLIFFSCLSLLFSIITLFIGVWISVRPMSEFDEGVTQDEEDQILDENEENKNK